MTDQPAKRGRPPRAEPFQPHRVSASLTRGLVREMDAERGVKSRTSVLAAALSIYLAVQRGQAAVVWVAVEGERLP